MPISVFVPPHNALSKRGLDGGGGAGLTSSARFCRFGRRCGPGIGRRLATGGAIDASGARPGAATRPARLSARAALRGHAEFGCHSLIPATTLEELRAGFEKRAGSAATSVSRRITGKSTRRSSSVMRTFLDFAAGQPDVRFVPAEETVR